MTVEPFDNAQLPEEPRLVRDFRLAGQLEDRWDSVPDQSTGLFYNGFRYYDPFVGRYVTTEPKQQPLGYIPLGIFYGQYRWTHPGEYNSYHYAYSNPIICIDEDGLCGFCAGEGVKGVQEAPHGAEALDGLFNLGCENYDRCLNPEKYDDLIGAEDLIPVGTDCDALLNDPWWQDRCGDSPFTDDDDPAIGGRGSDEHETPYDCE